MKKLKLTTAQWTKIYQMLFHPELNGLWKWKTHSN